MQSMEDRSGMLNIGTLFRREREKLGLTLRQVEDATKLSASGINRIETGMVQRPSFRDIISLAAFYNIPPSSLLTVMQGGPASLHRKPGEELQLEMNALIQAIINNADAHDLDFVRLYLKAFLEAQRIRASNFSEDG